MSESVMLTRVIWMSVLCPVTWGHVDVCGPCHHQGPYQTVIWVHYDVQALLWRRAISESIVLLHPGSALMSMALLRYYWRPCECPWCVLPPKVVLMSVIHVAARAFSGSVLLLQLVCSWSLLLPKTRWKHTICAVLLTAKGKEMAFAVMLITADIHSEKGTWKISVTTITTPTSPSSILKRTSLKRIPKKNDKDAEGEFSTADGFW